MEIQEASQKKKELEYRLMTLISSEIQKFMNDTGLFVEEIEIVQVATRTLDSNEPNLLITDVRVRVHL